MKAEGSHFRTLAVSDPKWEADQLRQVTVNSDALRGRGDITLFVPPHVDGLAGVPLVLLLHGVYGSHWNWTRKGGVHRTAIRLIETGVLPPLVIAMPSDGLLGDGTAYLELAGKNFESWIVDEVPQAAREVVSAVTIASPQCIAGLSMGGYGAMRLGAKYGPRFRGISAHSAVTRFDQFADFIEEPLAGFLPDHEEHDVLDVIRSCSDSLPPLRFDCGTEDPLLEQNRALHDGLVTAGVPHQYKEYPGDHDWTYWEKHIEKTLAFFGEILGRPAPDPGPPVT